jgi:hypothetical protein
VAFSLFAGKKKKETQNIQMSDLPNLPSESIPKYQSPYWTFSPLNGGATAESIHSNPIGWILSIAPIPIALAIIMTLLFGAYAIHSCIRYARGCHRCCYPVYVTRHKNAPGFTAGLTVMASLSFLGIAFVLIYWTRLTNDSSTMDDQVGALQEYQNQLVNATSQTLDLISTTNQSVLVLQEQLMGSSQSQIQQIQSDLEVAQSQTESIQSTVQTDLYFVTIRSYLHTYGMDNTPVAYTMLGIYLIFVIVPYGLLVSYTIRARFRQRSLPKRVRECTDTTEGLAAIVNFSFAILLGLGSMIASFALNDTCRIGIPVVLNEFVNSTDLYYYTANTLSNTTQNPFFNEINQTIASMDQALLAIGQIEASTNASHLVESNLLELRDFVSVNITELLSRDNIHPLFAALEDSLCMPTRSDFLLFGICLIGLFVVMTIYFVITHLRPLWITSSSLMIIQEVQQEEEEEESSSDSHSRSRSNSD